MEAKPKFLCAQECQDLRNKFEDSKEVERLEFDDKKLANSLWERWIQLHPHPFIRIVDLQGGHWKPERLNSHFRLARYQTGDHFHRHEDGFFWESWDYRSFSSFMVYLNDVPADQGGSTNFYEHGITVQPQEGLLVVFDVDDIMHQGEELKQGFKYLLRTDIMFRLQQESMDSKMKVWRQNLFDAYQKATETDNPDDWDLYFKLDMNAPAKQTKQDVDEEKDQESTSQPTNPVIENWN